MIPVPFVKFTTFGNNFVIVDETRIPFLSEHQKSVFANQATDTCFGVGCDNLLVIQNCCMRVFKLINAERRYFEELPSFPNVEFVFRMFEPDGQEAYSCGNGLMSIAAYLLRHYGISEATILTEIPTGFPRRITLGTETATGTSWVNMGIPGRVPQEMSHPSAYLTSHTGLDLSRPLKIRFRARDLLPYTGESSMTVQGYLVFTGEPHLVIFPQEGFSIRALADIPFLSPGGSARSDKKTEKRYNFGSWLVQKIGSYLNTHYNHLFPKGINVNFARTIQGDTEILEYRCFERGIYRETLACGTGALAVSYAAREQALTRSRDVAVWPSRCRWYQCDAEMRVSERESGWYLRGYPQELFGGQFAFDAKALRPVFLDEREPSQARPASTGNRQKAVAG